MPTRVLLGDEALAQGAIDAGLSGAYAYPGTPSTEITEYVQHSPEGKDGQVRCQWSANEKTALEAAIGMSFAGKRAMASMKHVGLNVAADPFVNAALVGANGGLMINVADDPSMHSSQNEQDTRVYTDLALMPCIEPATQAEAYAAPAMAFDLSERLEIPVLVRLTTRLAHSRATIETGAKRDQNEFHLPEDERRYILLPAIARGRYEELLAKQPDLLKASETSAFTHYTDAEDRSLGIIACGIAYNYLMEATGGEHPHPILKIGQYPIPQAHIERMVAECDAILVVEEGYPYVEEKLRGLPARTEPQIRGRLSGHLPRTGELNPQLVAHALGIETPKLRLTSSIPAPRPPALCPGCPHIDTANALKEALSDQPNGRVFGDIGCYTLSALPPYEVVDTCVEMGGSITLAKGSADAGLHPAVALIGDSTFAHSGMAGLLDCVNDDSSVTILIVDNLTTAMTGGQESSARNRLATLCAGIGVDEAHIRVIQPLPNQHEANVAVLREEMAFNGPSVVIAERECIQTARRKARAKKASSGGTA